MKLNSLNKLIASTKRKVRLLHNKHMPYQYGLNRSQSSGRKKIIVSLASYPPRFPYIHHAIKSLLLQSVKPDKIILNVSADVDVSENITRLLEYGLEIKRVNDDLKAHNKYFYVMQEYPDDIIITVDDDLVYEQNLIKWLLDSYAKFPEAVSACRAHQILKTGEKILPYREWQFNYKEEAAPSLSLLATGGAGTLYPPHCMAEEYLFDKEKIRELCLNADDIWLKFMQILKGTPVVKVKSSPLLYVKGTQDTALWKTNLAQGENDEFIKNMQDHLHIFLSDHASSVSE